MATAFSHPRTHPRTHAPTHPRTHPPTRTRTHIQTGDSPSKWEGDPHGNDAVRELGEGYRLATTGGKGGIGKILDVLSGMPLETCLHTHLPFVRLHDQGSIKWAWLV